MKEQNRDAGQDNIKNEYRDDAVDIALNQIANQRSHQVIKKAGNHKRDQKDICYGEERGQQKTDFGKQKNDHQHANNTEGHSKKP